MRLLAVFSVATSLIAGVAAIGDCDAGPWGDLLAIGDIHDDSKVDIDICETQWKQGRVVKGIEVWADKNSIAGIQLTYSNDDTSHMIGSKKGEHHKKLDWDPKTVFISEVNMWSNPRATRTGKIYIKLTNGDTLDVGMDKPAETTHYMEVGAGVMLGGYGRADTAVTAWGFMFLESKVKEISIGDFKYDEDLKTVQSQRK
jgi:hypothetical protein